MGLIDQAPSDGQPPTFSIIVPVYNTAAYLETCIQSILDQSVPDLEVIAVDDGSTDDCRRILDDIARRDNRVRVLSKINGGQGSARNLGIAEARGHYVAFVDSDDTIAHDMLARVAVPLLDPALDIVSFGIEFRDNAGRLVASRGPIADFSATGEAIFLDAMLDRNFLTSACNKVYRRTFLVNNELTFPELRAYEDSVFSRHVAQHASSVVYLKDRLYFALTRSGSTSRGVTVTSFSRAAEMITIERKMFDIGDEDRIRQDAFRAHVARFWAHLLILAAFRVNDPTERAICQRIADEGGFTECANDRRALKLLPARVRAQIFLARHNKLLRATAQIATRLNYIPY